VAQRAEVEVDGYGHVQAHVWREGKGWIPCLGKGDVGGSQWLCGASAETWRWYGEEGRGRAVSV
jgi:hypothetical protein